MLKKGKCQVKPSGKLKKLIEKYDIPIEVAKAIGGMITVQAQRLFIKWSLRVLLPSLLY